MSRTKVLGIAVTPLVVLVVGRAERALRCLDEGLRSPDEEVEIVHVCTTPAALETLLERDVAVVLIDGSASEVDGFALAELMREGEHTRYIPTIFVAPPVTTPADVSRAYAVGAADVVIGPIAADILCRKVEVFVGLAAERRKLVEARRGDELFMTIVSHDLRNPLNAIQASTEIGLLTATSEAMRQRFEQIHAGAKRMKRMIDQLLDRTRIQNGVLVISPTPANLRELVMRAVQDVPGQTDRFEVTATGDLEGTWDVDRLVQVLSNLARNAADHSPPGTAIAIRIDGTVADSLALEIQNEGLAIPPALLDVLFEPFHGHSRGGGLGLGLFICNHFVVAHGGTLTVQSSDDTGTVVRILLPRHPRRPARPQTVEMGG